VLGVSGQLVRYRVRNLRMAGQVVAERSGLTLSVTRQKDGLVPRESDGRRQGS